METAHKCFACKNLKNLGHLALPTLLYTEQPETFCCAASTLAPARRRCVQEEGGGGLAKLAREPRTWYPSAIKQQFSSSNRQIAERDLSRHKENEKLLRRVHFINPSAIDVGHRLWALWLRGRGKERGMPKGEREKEAEREGE